MQVYTCIIRIHGNLTIFWWLHRYMPPFSANLDNGDKEYHQRSIFIAKKRTYIYMYTKNPKDRGVQMCSTTLVHKHSHVSNNTHTVVTNTLAMFLHGETCSVYLPSMVLCDHGSIG